MYLTRCSCWGNVSSQEGERKGQLCKGEEANAKRVLNANLPKVTRQGTS